MRATHYDFVGRVGDGAAIPDDAASYSADQNGHGTQVAGVVLGSMHGVARSATLHPVKVRTGANTENQPALCAQQGLRSKTRLVASWQGVQHVCWQLCACISFSA